MHQDIRNIGNGAKMKYLVTGAAGFIGSNLTDRLLDEGHEVVCVDINADGYWNDKAENHIGWDIRDTSKMFEISNGVDVIFHLAAETKIQESIKNPVECFDVNTTGTCSLLEAAKENNVSKFIFSSTCGIYKCDWKIQPEGSTEDCLNPYSTSKKNAENIVKMYSSMYGLNTLIFRYFNVYGPRQHEEGQYAPVLGIFLKQLTENKPLTIVGDGSQKRDLVYVDDVVNANILGATTHTESGSLYNVGTGVNYSIQEIADMISPVQTYIDKRPGEIQSTQALINKIKNDLQWKPTTSMEDWLKNELKEIEWQKKQLV
jgi:nucleoside-diphosphate-sugar epimerase